MIQCIYLLQLLMVMAWWWLSRLWMVEYTWRPSLYALLIGRRRRRLISSSIVERWEPTQMVLWKIHLLYWLMPFSWSGLSWYTAIRPTQTYSTGVERQGLLTTRYAVQAFPPPAAGVLYSAVARTVCGACIYMACGVHASCALSLYCERLPRIYSTGRNLYAGIYVVRGYQVMNVRLFVTLQLCR